jgi:hypothetical protein
MPGYPEGGPNIRHNRKARTSGESPDIRGAAQYTTALWMARPGYPARRPDIRRAARTSGVQPGHPAAKRQNMKVFGMCMYGQEVCGKSKPLTNPIDPLLIVRDPILNKTKM